MIAAALLLVAPTPLPATEPWWDPSWAQRLEIQITEQSGFARSDYTLLITVPFTAGMQASFADLRFVAPGATTALAHWTETSTASEAQVWVRAGALPAGATTSIHLYFDNPAAAAADDLNAAFFIADDFEDGTIDTSLWSVNWAGASESGGLLQLPDPGSGGHEFLTQWQNSFNPGEGWEFSWLGKKTATGSADYGAWGFTRGSYDNIAGEPFLTSINHNPWGSHFLWADAGTMFDSGTLTTTGCDIYGTSLNLCGTTTCASGTPTAVTMNDAICRYRGRITSLEATVEVRDPATGATACAETGPTTSWTWDGATCPAGWTIPCCSPSTKLEVDHAWVRPLASPEPTFVLGPSEEPSPTITSIEATDFCTQAPFDIAGQGFDPAATVSVDGLAATVLAATATSLTVQPPALSDPGFEDVTVTTVLGSASAPDGLTVTPALELEEISGALFTKLHHASQGLAILVWGTGSLAFPLPLGVLDTCYGLLVDPTGPHGSTSLAVPPGSPLIFPPAGYTVPPTFSGSLHLQYWWVDITFQTASFSNLATYP